MREEERDIRKREIEAAAYGLLDRKGYAGTSMQGIAKAAGASNETLYSWYGGKHGLFRALIESNAALVRDKLHAIRDTHATPPETLARIGPALLGMLLGPRAIALNRAAAADPTGELGATLAASGRDAVVPALAEVVAKALHRGDLSGGSAAEITETWIALLVGDLQIRRVTGATPEPAAESNRKRSERALLQLRRLYPPGPPLDAGAASA